MVLLFVLVLVCYWCVIGYVFDLVIYSDYSVYEQFAGRAEGEHAAVDARGPGTGVPDKQLPEVRS